MRKITWSFVIINVPYRWFEKSFQCTVQKQVESRPVVHDNT